MSPRRLTGSRLPRLAALAALELAATPEERPRARLRSQVTLPVVVLVIAVLYFLWAALLGLGIIALPALEPTITPADWAVFGALLFLVLLILLAVEYRRTRGGTYEPPAPAAGHRAAATTPQAAPAAAPSSRWIPDELVVTAETQQGRRVLEYSRPPKSEHPRAVYAKCLVPVDPQLVLRVEDLVAEAKE